MLMARMKIEARVTYTQISLRVFQGLDSVLTSTNLVSGILVPVAKTLFNF